ncbi:ABC transporter, permease/ATP-binding protein [Alteracholeplasma palmae J233]|uniref:ABC transporter, permease/ATP-binding protein n=1 Tax=Alteracholeplasma palmae (strain ATCC 49389 / J233) TaxID=1318466 RepID=U4KJP2_ALTPJ|nr:ABC transporter ATP-binding protein/permease [Alteracholeplasma palmae]CCV63623.1 ABC transporter, permease/ATP-binding protein [Alteracholeplasma palmae J233]
MYELKRISKEYKNGKEIIQVLKEINMKLPPNGMVFIVGKSGSGKSTLLNILGGLETPTKGNIKYKNKEIDDLSFKRDIVSFVFQDFNLLYGLTVVENLKIVNKLSDERVKKLLTSVDMLDKINTKIKYLSIGEKQRLSIARALAKNFEIMLLDEPTGSLDITNRKKVFDLLKKISTEKLIIIVSHDLESAFEYSDSIIEIKDGIAGNLISNKETKLLDTTEKMPHSNNEVFDKKSQFRYATSLLFLNKFRFIITMLILILSTILTFTQLNLSNFNTEKALNNAITKNNDFAVPLSWSVRNEPTNKIEQFSKGEDLYNKINDNDSQYNKLVTYISSNQLINNNESKLNETVLYLFKENEKIDLSITEGRLPNNKNEVLISDFLSIYKFNQDEVIGKKISMPIETLDTEIILTVVGIVETDYKDIRLFNKIEDEVYLKGNKDAVTFNYMTLYTKESLLFSGITDNIITIQSSNFLQTDQLTEIYTQPFNSLKYKKYDNEQLIEGKLPEKINQIVVSDVFLKKHNLKFNEIKEINYLYKDIRATINKNRYLDIINFFEILESVEIVGITESKSDILVSHELSIVIENKLKYYSVDGYAVSKPKQSFIEKSNGSNIYFNFRYLEPIYTMVELLKGPIVTVVLTVEFILIILSALSLLLYCQNAVKTKRREISIIKSLGVKNSKLFNVFLIHNMTQTLFSTVIGIIAGLFFIKMVNMIVSDGTVFNINYNLFLITPISLIAIFMISFCICLIGTIIPFISIKKISIASELKINQ